MFVPPVDQYRKRIGQETRKDKLVNKEVRRQHLAKENSKEVYKDSALIILAVLTLFALVYGLLFFAVQKKAKTE